MDPINYFGQLAPTDLGQALLGGLQQRQAQQLAQQQQARALAQQAQLDAARDAAIKNPTAANYNALFLLDPKSQEAIKAAQSGVNKADQDNDLKEYTALFGLARAGRTQDVRARVQARIDADKKAGLDTADDEAFLEVPDDELAGYIGLQLAGVLGPEKFDQAFKTQTEGERADAKLPGELALTEAQAQAAEADAVKTNVEARELPRTNAADIEFKRAQSQRFRDQTVNEARRLDLDENALLTNTQLEMDKLLSKGTELTPGAEGRLSTAVTNAEASRQLATRATSLADRIATAPIKAGGVFASLKELSADAFGTQDPVSAIRKEYTALISSQAVANLPPGPASDKDIQLALKGFPKNSSNADTMASFLRGMAKLQNIKASREQARADWISENGNEGRARRDITVNGVRVPKGSTFGDFSTSAAAIERRESVGERSYLRYGK